MLDVRVQRAGCRAARELPWPKAAGVVCPNKPTKVNFLQNQTYLNPKYRGFFHRVGLCGNKATADVPEPHGH